MIEIAVIGTMEKEMGRELRNTAQHFRGKRVKVTIPEVNESELERVKKS